MKAVDKTSQKYQKK